MQTLAEAGIEVEELLETNDAGADALQTINDIHDSLAKMTLVTLREIQVTTTIYQHLNFIAACTFCTYMPNHINTV